MTMVAMKLLWTVVDNEMILNEMILGAQAFQLSNISIHSLPPT